MFLNFDEFHDDSYWISFYSFISNGAKIYYNKPIEDVIYTLSNIGELEQAYYIDFGAKQIPLEWRKDIEGHMDKIEEKYQCLKNHTIITDKYIIGTLWDQTKTKPFIADRTKNVLYLREPIADSDISDICDFQNNSIISLIFPGKYSDREESHLPNDVRRHLSTDNFVICVTELL